MRVLFLCHNHPELQPGGTEKLALGLFRSLRDHHGVEGLFLAATTQTLREPNPGTLLQAAPSGATDELLISLSHFDRFFLSQGDTYGLASALPALLAHLKPDVIHLHHPLLFGSETIDLLCRAAPRARMVATLHDYFAICPREGQLLTTDLRLCNGPSLDACRRCLPERTAVDLKLRDLSLRGAFNAFGALVAPSKFLRDRFVAAGWDPARIVVLPNGVPDVAAPAPHRPSPDGRRDRFGFFGHINRFKGSLVALGASAQLSKAGVPHSLALYGGTDYQPETFLAEFATALAAAPAARHHGGYAAADLQMRMAAVDWVVVPSIWWENAPLVVLEAFREQKPVICSGVGGMAEVVRDGENGLHAPVNDPAGLAAVMRRAIEERGLWNSLIARVRPPRSIAAVADDHLRLYQDICALPRNRGKTLGTQLQHRHAQ